MGPPSACIWWRRTERAPSYSWPGTRRAGRTQRRSDRTQPSEPSCCPSGPAQAHAPWPLPTWALGAWCTLSSPLKATSLPAVQERDARAQAKVGVKGVWRDSGEVERRRGGGRGAQARPGPRVRRCWSELPGQTSGGAVPWQGCPCSRQKQSSPLEAACKSFPRGDGDRNG